MRLLLDTHVFLWFVAGDRQLSSRARRRIEDPANDKLLSVASVWEIAIKLSLGELSLAVSLDVLVRDGAIDNGIVLLDVRSEHAMAVAHLPWHHKDPFDRLLVAQSSIDSLTLLSADAAFDPYGTPRVW